MYRVWPVQAGISTYATAFNNAVRAVNLSTDQTERFRTIVYERDSIVWLRMVDSTGAWTAEYMISDTADTVNVNGTRTAWNMYPSIASSRNGATTCVVWERRDSAGDHTVESCLLLANYLTRDNIDTVLAARLPGRLADAESFASSSVAYRRRTPAIIGVDSGYIVAWSGLDKGVTVTALKDLPPGLLGSGAFSVWDTARIDDVKAAPWEVNYVLGIGDTTARFTTLASVPYDSTVQINGGYISGTETAPYTPPGEPVPGHYEDLLMAHLAYQQGAKNTGVGQQIVYHALGYRFPPSDSTNTAPTIWASGAEHVTAKMRECSFLHPSIAVDSARVGVAFEIFQHNGSGVTWQKTIGLRFRDTVSTATTPRNWQTYVYRWGGPLRKLTNIIYHGSRYEYPSLTQFPAMDQGALEAVPEGGLAWHWSNPPGGEQNAQKMYRYGWTYVAGIADGQHPGMMLVPNVAGDPFSETGVLHRGTDGAQRSGVNVEGMASWYYPAYLQNTPGNEQRLFTDLPDDVLIHSSVEVGDTVFGDCVFETAKPKFRYDLVFTGGHTIHHPDHPDKWISGDPSDPDDFPTAPGLPPTFFDAPLGSTTLLDTLSDAWRVSRTGVFVAGEDPVTVRRIIVSTGAVVSWLGGYPYDSTLGMDADILMYAELVKLADSSVLWRSDTVSARTLGTTGTVVDELLEVPVGSVADSGMPVFLRMQGVATEGVRYALDGGFRFYTQDSTGTTFSKRLRPGPGESSASEVPAGLTVRVIPNPVRNSGELSLWIVQAGRVRGGVYDMLGNEILELPELEADAGGEYRIALPLAGMRAGQYLVRVESGSERASAQFNVVR